MAVAANRFQYVVTLTFCVSGVVFAELKINWLVMLDEAFNQTEKVNVRPVKAAAPTDAVCWTVPPAIDEAIEYAEFATPFGPVWLAVAVALVTVHVVPKFSDWTKKFWYRPMPPNVELTAA